MKQLFTLLFIIFSTVVYSQKVGINIANPLMTLHVESADSAALLLSNSQPFADSAKTALYFRSGFNFTGAIKTHVSNASFSQARMGLFTFTGPTATSLKERLSILDNGYVGIGTVKPTALLEVNGSLKLNGGSPGAGKVLTSDATGNATWQAPAANPVIHTYMDGDIVMEHNVEYQVPFNKNISGSIDTDNGYDNATDEYVIPVAGIYNFYANFLLQTGNSTPLARVSIYVYNSAGTFKDGAVIEERLAASSYQNKTVEHTFSLVQGDKIRIKAYQFSSPGTTVTLHNINSSQTYFRGFKIR